MILPATGGTITNKRDSNSLTITKTVTKDPANLPVTIPADTTFTVYHAENDQKYTSFKYSDMTNGTKVLANVPTGEYYVVETGADVTNYKLTVTGAYKDAKSGTVEANTASVTSSQAGSIDIINKYEREDNWETKTSLTIVKNVAGLEDAALSNNKTYYFSITGTDVYGQNVTQYATITLPDDADGKTVQLPISNSDGYTVTEVTKADATGVPVSTTNTPAAIANYQWTKVEFSGVMDASTAEGLQVALTEKDASATVTATNTYTRKTTEPGAGLTIKKVVTAESGVTAPANDEFTFTVVSTGGSYQLNGETVPAGTKTITLKGGETATIGSIDYGTTFTITETAKNGYTLESVVGGTVSGNSTTVTIDESTNSAEVTFTNHYDTNSFSIDKVDAEDAMARLDGAEFTLTGTTAAGESKAYSSKAGSDKGQLIFSNIPVGTYMLKETKAPADYELGTTEWTVVVTKDDVAITEKTDATGVSAVLEGIKTFFTGSAWGSYDETHHILQVKNTHDKGTITIAKTVTVEGTQDNQGTFTFDIHRKNAFNYTVVGKITVDFDNGTSAVSGDLNTNETYYLMEVQRDFDINEGEIDEDDYDLKVTYTDAQGNEIEPNNDGYIPVTLGSDAKNIQINCTNAYTRKTGYLEITKIVSGLVGDAADAEHAFTINLVNDKYADETYSYDVTVTGNGEITIGDEDPVTDAKIEVRTGTYTVTENNASIDKFDGPTVSYAYTVDAKEADSLTVSDGKTSTLTVTNAYDYQTPPPEELDGTISGTKVWNDGNDADGLRPTASASSCSMVRMPWTAPMRT